MVLLTKSTLKVRSEAIAPNGVLPIANGLSDGRPCSGMSIAITAKPCAASVADTASAWVRLPVMPCWKITTGQPLAGRLRPEAAFGIVASTGMVASLVLTGNGLAKVMLVEVGLRPAALNGGT